jgi:hypothetical protein
VATTLSSKYQNTVLPLLLPLQDSIQPEQSWRVRHQAAATWDHCLQLLRLLQVC